MFPSGKRLSDRKLCRPGYQGERSSSLKPVYHYKIQLCWITTASYSAKPERGRYSHITRGLLRAKLNHVLAEMGLSYVDLYLVHEPLVLPDFESGWQEFEKMKKDGLTRWALCDSDIVR